MVRSGKSVSATSGDSQCAPTPRITRFRGGSRDAVAPDDDGPISTDFTPLDQRVIASVEVVTIPLADYAKLLESKRQLAERVVACDQLMSARRSKIERNPEVAVFLVEKFGLMPVKDALRLCRRKFGQAATPSLSAAYRYWDRVRKEASNEP